MFAYFANNIINRRNNQPQIYNLFFYFNDLHKLPRKRIKHDEVIVPWPLIANSLQVENKA